MSGVISNNGSPRAASVTEQILALTTRNPRRALALARRALAEADTSDAADVVRPRLLRALGHAHRAGGDFAAARDAYRESRRLFRRSGEEREHAIAALGLVDACMYLGRTREALDAARAAHSVFLRNGDRLRIARLETNVGNLYHHLDDLTPALERYEHAARLFEELGAPLDRARVDHNRANILTYLGRRDEAESLYLSAEKVLTAAGETVQATQIRYGLACLKFLNGEYSAAIGELEEVRPLLRKLGARPLLALADIDLAEVLLAMRFYSEALALARAASRWFRSQGLIIDCARCDLVAGMALARLGQVAASRSALDRAQTTYRHRDLATGIASVRLGRALLSRISGRPRAAGGYALRAHRVFRRYGFSSRALAAGAFAAESLLDAGSHERAGAIARAMLRTSRSPGDAFSRARLSRVEGASAAALGDSASALRHYRTALEWTSRAHSTLVVDEWRMGFLEGEPPVLDEFLALLLRRRPGSHPSEIWRWVSRGRWQTHPPSVSPGTPGPAIMERVELLRRDLEACYGRLWKLSTHARAPAPIALRSVETRALRLERQLRRLAAPGSAPAYEQPADLPPPPDGELRLAYFSAGGQLAALAHDADSWRVFRNLASVAEVDHRVRLFHYQMDVSSSALPTMAAHSPAIDRRAREHLRELSEMILDPVWSGAREPRRIRVFPHGSLFRIPFAALTRQGVPLVARYEVVLDPRIELVARSSGTARSGACVVGFGGGTDKIETEARAMADCLDAAGVDVQLHCGEQARFETLVEASGTAALLHLVAHAVYRPHHPEFSALRFHDRWVSGRDFARLPLEGAIVVLSACETGPRGAVAGEEMLGLARGIVAAGARTLLSTLWRVDDQTTLAFMKDTYARWRSQGLGSAVAAVQCRGFERGEDVFLWAPYCLSGDPEARLEDCVRRAQAEV